MVNLLGLPLGGTRWVLPVSYASSAQYHAFTTDVGQHLLVRTASAVEIASLGAEAEKSHRRQITSTVNATEPVVSPVRGMAFVDFYEQCALSNSRRRDSNLPLASLQQLIPFAQWMTVSSPVTIQPIATRSPTPAPSSPMSPLIGECGGRSLTL